MEDFKFLKDELNLLRERSLLRTLSCVESAQGPVMTVDGRELVVFCSNNYLNLAEDSEIAQAVIETVKQRGYGAGASRLISGTTGLHLKAEEKLAGMFGKEAALLLPSGWAANEAVIRTIPQKGDIVLLDKLDHASIIDAARACEAQFRTFRRDRLDKLERFLQDGSFAHKFIVSESIFSMDGERADLKRLVALKEKYGAVLIIDEAHAFGCLGEKGAGLAEELGVLDGVDIIVATMSKAVGATGGVVAGKKVVIDYLVNKARAFIYTTAPPPANCAAILKAIEIIQTQRQRREKLRENAVYIKRRLQQASVNTGCSNSHIIPVIIGGEADTLRIAGKLKERGFYVSAIRPPTVPAGTSRLRISLQSRHSQEQLDGLCDAIISLVQAQGDFRGSFCRG
ncbi:MAG: 8-amino-7-oxononanoate synthase [Planctomycetota bacterium]